MKLNSCESLFFALLIATLVLFYILKFCSFNFSSSGEKDSSLFRSYSPSTEVSLIWFWRLNSSKFKSMASIWSALRAVPWMKRSLNSPKASCSSSSTNGIGSDGPTILVSWKHYMAYSCFLEADYLSVAILVAFFGMTIRFSNALVFWVFWLKVFLVPFETMLEPSFFMDIYDPEVELSYFWIIRAAPLLLVVLVMRDLWEF